MLKGFNAFIFFFFNNNQSRSRSVNDDAMFCKTPEHENLDQADVEANSIPQEFPSKMYYAL